jgi:hypothetical protein
LTLLPVGATLPDPVQLLLSVAVALAVVTEPLTAYQLGTAGRLLLPLLSGVAAMVMFQPGP